MSSFGSDGSTDYDDNDDDGFLIECNRITYKMIELLM